MNTNSDSAKPLNVFKLMMMTVVAIDSLKNLPINAFYGSNFVIYFAIGIVTFFLPCALIVAELASSLPRTGGVYIWVREAYGLRIAFLTVWIQWMIAIIWYPTILSFITIMLFAAISSHPINSWYVIISIWSLFWLTVLIISKGIEMSSRICTMSAILGVIIPMFLMTALGGWWLYTSHSSQISLKQFLHPHLTCSADDLRLFLTLLYSLMGMEMIGAHAGDVRNPARDYPMAIFGGGIIILLTIVPSSLAIAIVIPHHHIDISSSVIDSFRIFLQAFRLEWLLPCILIAMVVGSFGIFYSWLLCSSRCLLVAAEDGCLPEIWHKKNKNDMPMTQLLFQGIIFSILSFIIIVIPSFNIIFLILTAACAELALIYYIFIFSAAFILRLKQPTLSRPFRLGSFFTLCTVCIVAISTCVVAMICGFIPPSDNAVPIWKYEIILLTLTVGSIVSGLFIFRKQTAALCMDLALSNST